MSKWFEPELNNNFEFIFGKIEDDEKIWYKAVVYADDYAFSYVENGKGTDYHCYSRYLKPNYHHEIIGKVYVLVEFDEDSYWSSTNENEEECSSYNQTIEFDTNELGEIDLENIEFYDY